jgi:dCMP deaminase
VRKSREEVFMEMVRVLEQRSTCQRAKVAAIIVKEGRPVSVGYNGPASGVPECEECMGADCNRSVHAEMNAIAFAAKEGVSTNFTTLYCSMSPCINCAKIILNAGVRRIVYCEEYRLKEGINFLKENGVLIERCQEEGDECELHAGGKAGTIDTKITSEDCYYQILNHSD